MKIIHECSETDLLKWGTELAERANPLCYVSSIGAVHLTTFLLENGFATNETSLDPQEMTALEAAAFGGHNNVVQLLLDNGAEIDAQGGSFANALEAAVVGYNKSTVQLLLDRGANINIVGSDCLTPVQLAAYAGSDAILRLLLDRGAAINARMGKFGSPLRSAIARDKIEIAELLLSNGAEIDSPYSQSDQLLEQFLEKGFDEFETARLQEHPQDPTGYITAKRAEIDAQIDTEKAWMQGKFVHNQDTDKEPEDEKFIQP